MSFAQFLAVLLARWKLVLGVFLFCVLAALATGLLQTKRYTAAASVVIEARPDPLSAVLYPAGVNPGMVATQIDVIQSERVAYRVVRNLKLNENAAIREQWLAGTKGEVPIEQWLAEQFQQGLDVRPSRESNVITLTYKAPDPRFAAGLVNAFVQAYLETNLEMRVEPARQFSSFFDERAKAARETLEKAQSSLSAFQKAKGIIANDERLDVENSRLNELSSQLVALQAVATDSGSRQTAARGASADRMQEVLANPLIAGLKSDQARLEARLQELRSRLGERHPQVLEAQANLEELRRRIDTETSKVTGSMGVANSINQQRVGELRGALEAQRSKVLQMKAVRDDAAVLIRDVENAQRAYDQIQTRLNQTTLESLANQSNVAVLSQALPPTHPTSPRLPLNLMLGVFVGTLLGVAVAFLFELFDRRLRSAADLAALTALPVLGVLPRSDAGRWLGRRKTALAAVMPRHLLGRQAASD